MSAHPKVTAGTTSVEDFLDAIAHEVRTPLSIARMAAETARRQDLSDAERERLLGMIVRNTDLALLLLDRMSLARDVEAGSLQLQFTETDIAHLVAETVEDVRSLVLGDRPVHVEGSTTAPVEVDTTGLREILLNLLLNAAKYSPSHTPIEVSVGDEGDAVTVVVSDYGCGIPPEHLEHIFEQYAQVEAGSSGIGLGLYISRGLARAHGGDLEARPRGQSGSEFVLRLPRQRTENDGEDPVNTPVGAVAE
jgi:two-component system, OmpR family, sensor kinase